MEARLNKSGYKLHHDEHKLVIAHTDGGLLILEVLSMALGVLALVFGLQGMSWQLTLLALILIGVPFTSHRWRLPGKVVFLHETGDIVLHYVFSHRTIAPSHRPELSVDYYAKSSFVSPFQEGYQDHFYTFQLTVDQERLPMFRIKSRTRIDDEVEQMVGEVSKWVMPIVASS